MIRTVANRLAIAFVLLAAAIGGAIVIPAARAQFAGQSTLAKAPSGGSANAQTITLGNVLSLGDLKGVTISWVVGAGLTNTGPAQINVNGFGLVNIYRRNSGALIALGGSEMPAGYLVKATYDGTQFELETDYTGGAPVGSEVIANYGTADPGYVLEYGECMTSANDPALVNKIGTTYNSQDGCTTGQTGIPDRRGRTVFGKDNMGGTAAGRITVAGGNFDGTTLGAAGGGQNQTLLQGNVPNYNLSVASITGYVPSMSVYGNSNQGGLNTGPYGYYVPTGNGSTNTGLTTPQTNIVLSGSIPSGGSGMAFSTLSDGQIAVYEIKL